VVYRSKVCKESFTNQYSIIHFPNGDVKQVAFSSNNIQVLPLGDGVYYFAEVRTTQTTLRSGQVVYQFHNGQLEIHSPDGSKEIRFADGTEKRISAAGEQRTFYSESAQ